jgi:zinc transport system substrate-binding protein
VCDGGITTIFVDPLEPDDAAQALARQTNTKTAPLSALEGLTEEQQKAGDDYFSLMRQNLTALREALSCP